MKRGILWLVSLLLGIAFAAVSPVLQALSPDAPASIAFAHEGGGSDDADSASADSDDEAPLGLGGGAPKAL